MKDSTFFITLCCEERGRDQLCNGRVSSQLLAAAQHYHEQGYWHMTVWLLMPDHLHALIGCPRAEQLSKLIADWKRYTARTTGVAWQKGFFDHRLRNDESVDQKAEYIRQNPVRKGLVADVEDWPHVWWASKDCSRSRPISE